MKTIQVEVLEPILLKGKRVLPAKPDSDPVVIDLPEERYEELVAFGAVKEFDGQAPTTFQKNVADTAVNLMNTLTSFQQEAADASAAKLTKLVAVIPQLKEDDFTASNGPEVKALSELIGEKVTAEERNTAWAQYQAAQTNQDDQSQDQDQK